MILVIIVVGIITHVKWDKHNLISDNYNHGLPLSFTACKPPETSQLHQYGTIRLNWKHMLPRKERRIVQPRNLLFGRVNHRGTKFQETNHQSFRDNENVFLIGIKSRKLYKCFLKFMCKDLNTKFLIVCKSLLFLPGARIKIH